MSGFITIKAPSIIVSYFAQVIGDNHSFIAGGALRAGFRSATERFKTVRKSDEGFKASDVMPYVERFFSIESAKDIDVFSPSREEFEKTQELFKKKSTANNYVSKNSEGYIISHSLPLVDLVKKDFGTPEEIISNFDFTVSQCALFREDEEYYLIFSKEFLQDLFHNRLRWSKNFFSRNLDDSFILERVMRYHNYGFIGDDSFAKKTAEVTINKYNDFKSLGIDDDVLVENVSELIYPPSMKKLFNDKIPLEGSYSSSYSRERKILRYLLERAEDPDYGKTPLELFGEKYGSYSLPAKYNNTIGRIPEKLLKFLESKESVIGKDNLVALNHFMFCFDFADKHKQFMKCNVCYKIYTKCSYYESLVGSSDISRVNTHGGFLKNEPVLLRELSEDSLEVLYKIFMMNKDDDKWVFDVVQFFLDYSSSLDYRISLKNWHDGIESGMFDPTLSPVMMLGLMEEAD